MKQIFLEIPKVYWSDIGGQHGVKQKLTEAVEWPLKVSDFEIHFQRLETKNTSIKIAP